MKKLIKILLAFSLFLMTGCGSNTSTTQDTTETASKTDGKENVGNFLAIEEDGVIDFSPFGMKVTIPEELESDDYNWAIKAMVLPELGQGSLITVDKDENETHELYLSFIAKRKPINPDDFVDEEMGLTKNMVYDLGTNGTFYYVGMDVNDIYQVNPDYVNEKILTKLDESARKPYIERLEKVHEVLNHIELTDLVLPAPETAADIQTSKLMDMKVQNFDGNEVRLGDLISQNKVTMLNFWATFCQGCTQEMPWLEKLSQEYKDQGFGIVGICMDVEDPDDKMQDDILEKAKGIVTNSEVTYPCVIGNTDIRNFYKFAGYPTTFFVDSEGNMILDPILGYKTEQAWTEVIEESLSK